MKNARTFWVAVVIALAASISAPIYAFAACSSPAANEGALEFFSTEYKICNGTDWESIDLGTAVASCTANRTIEFDNSLNEHKFCLSNNYQTPKCKTETVQTGNCSASTEALVTGNPGAASDQFGFSVSVGGEYMAIGAPGTSSNNGKVYLYKKIGGAWTTDGSIAGAAGEQFGYAVSASGDTVLVGAPSYTGTQSNQGAAYVYVRTGTATWTLQGSRILSGSPAANANFGSSVSLFFNTAAIGSYKETGSQSAQGVVYVYLRSGSTWSLQQKVMDDAPAANDQFGFSISVNGDTLAVGAPANASNGVVHIFNRSAGTWTEGTELVASDGSSGHQFGYSVYLNGDNLVAGAPTGNKAYYFYRSAGSFTQKKIFTPGDAVNGDFGRSVAYVSGYILVGAPTHTTNTGAVYIFEGSDTNWSQRKMYQASDAATGNYFGHAVAMDSLSIAVGAYAKSSSQGYAYFYPLSFASQALVHADIASNPSHGHNKIAVSGDTLIIGATAYDHAGTDNRGRAYIFKRDANGVWAYSQSLNSPSPVDSEMFGTDVAIDGNTAVVTAKGTKKAYVFTRTDASSSFGAGTALTDSGQTGSTEYGFSVDIGDGVIVVGDSTAASTSLAGRIIIYTWNGSSWAYTTYFNGDTNDRLGTDVAVSGDWIAAGAPQHASAVDNLGQVHLYKRTNGTWAYDSVVTTPGGVIDDQMGYSVALNNGTLAFGSVATAADKVQVHTLSGGVWSPQATIPAPVSNKNFGRHVDLIGDKLAIGAAVELGTNAATNVGAFYLYKRTGTSWSQEARFPSPDNDQEYFGISVAIGPDYYVGIKFNGSQEAYVYSGAGVLQTCDGAAVNQTVCGSYGSCFTAGMLDYSPANGMRWCNGSVWRQFKMLAASLGSFTISGITGGTDSTQDNSLANGLNPTVHWGNSSNAANYDLVIKNDAETVTMCSSLTVTSTSASPSSCGLVNGVYYKAFVTARSGGGSTLVSTNQPYRFLVGTVSVGAFSITGVTGGTYDTTADGILDDGTTPTINWSAASNADFYDVVVKNSAGTVTLCSALNVAAPATSAVVSGCSLTAGSSYKVYVNAKAPGTVVAASNEPFNFTVYQTYTVEFTTAGAGSWVVPAGVTSLTVQTLGGGGGGVGTGSSQGAGGGGGGYARSVDISVSGGQTVYYSVGAGGAIGSNGGESWINKLANSAPASAVNGARAAGGTGGGSGGAGLVGATLFSGGNGAAAQGGGGARSGSGGGGAAGGAAAGTAGTAGAGGTAGVGGGGGSEGTGKFGPWLGGGGGGTAASSSVAAQSGSVIGGGGGGGASSTNGGQPGARGQVRIQYKAP